jgi:hypothetical protein
MGRNKVDELLEGFTKYFISECKTLDGLLKTSEEVDRISKEYLKYRIEDLIKTESKRTLESKRNFLNIVDKMEKYYEVFSNEDWQELGMYQRLLREELSKLESNEE